VHLSYFISSRRHRTFQVQTLGQKQTHNQQAERAARQQLGFLALVLPHIDAVESESPCRLSIHLPTGASLDLNLISHYRAKSVAARSAESILGLLTSKKVHRLKKRCCQTIKTV
jgi:hypothetical protein